MNVSGNVHLHGREASEYKKTLSRRLSDVSVRPGNLGGCATEDSIMLGSGMSNSMAVGPVAGRRPKVSLKQGRSLMDWIRLGASGRDIQGFGGKFHTVTMEELAKHSQVDDCWMLLRGINFRVLVLVFVFTRLRVFLLLAMRSWYHVT